MGENNQHVGSPFIKINNITVIADGGQYFNDTSVIMEYGQNWVIAGPTGSGKSTFVNAILDRNCLLKGDVLFYFDGCGEEGRAYCGR